MKTFVTVLMAGIAAFLISCSKEYPKTVKIEYRIYGLCDSDGLVRVTYSNANFLGFTLDSVPLPFDTTLVRTVGRYNSAGVEGISKNGEALTAEIYVDENLVASNTASGSPIVRVEAFYQFK